MYAVVKTGGKQYTVHAGEVLDVEKIEGEAGTRVDLPVLFLNNNGAIVSDKDALADVKVTAEIVDQHKGPKQIVFKFKKRKGYKKKNGHRQNLTRIAIVDLNGETAEAPKPKAPKAEAAAELEVAPAEQSAEDLSAKTVAELREIASERGIQIPSGSRKADIIELIQNA